MRAFGFNMIFIIKSIMENLERKCPKCDSIINYKSSLGYKVAIKNNSICRKCAASGENNGMYGRTGDKNPFFGKTHSEEIINKLKTVDRSYTQTEEFRDKISQLNKNKIIGTHGRSIHDCWVDRYGEEIANDKLKETKLKHSKNNSGEGNPMYGKPSPNGSGNGWSGWYKGWFFRSLRELTYMIKVIERFKLEWKSAESNDYKISYIDYSGKTKNYFPDFIIADKYIIESKPKRLWNSDTVIRKKQAAIEFAREHNLKYKLVDVGRISDEEIKVLYDTGLIKFIDRYERLYKEKIG